MGECILHGASGGAASLNFRIVGGTSAPVSPTENTIWVNTSYEITSYVFASKTPESAQDGCVCIKTGAYSSAEFSLTKQNSIMVYPLLAKQYINGEFVDVEAKSYQGGEWVDWWNRYLYEAGNEHVVFTGGWSLDEYKYNTHSAGTNVVKNQDKIIIQGTNNLMTVCGTNNPIDLSSISTIYVDWEGTGATSNVSLHFGVSKTKVLGTTTVKEINFGNVAARRTNYIDVSNVDGECYVYASAGSNYACRGYIYNVWCE